MSDESAYSGHEFDCHYSLVDRQQQIDLEIDNIQTGIHYYSHL